MKKLLSRTAILSLLFVGLFSGTAFAKPEPRDVEKPVVTLTIEEVETTKDNKENTITNLQKKEGDEMENILLLGLVASIFVSIFACVRIQKLEKSLLEINEKIDKKEK